MFVSSTCYDLNQIRADLRRFFVEMGLDPILSETPAFPVSPHTTTVDNCLRAVRERADIFVIIIGSRYGSQNETGKSITNLEYLEARARGLPVYVFVLKQILNILPVWKENAGSNFSSVVDTTKVFEFVESLRSSKNHWVFGFEEAAHIIEILRNQLGYLFMEGLALLDRVKALSLPKSLAMLPGKPLKLILERPIGWEFLFFSSVLEDELIRDQPSKWDLQYGLRLISVRKLNDVLEVVNWISNKYVEIKAFANSFEQLMNKAAQDAFGKPGEPGNPEHLLYVARRIAHLRRAFLEWTIDFNCVEAPVECDRLLGLVSESSKGAIQIIESMLT